MKYRLVPLIRILLTLFPEWRVSRSELPNIFEEESLTCQGRLHGDPYKYLKKKNETIRFALLYPGIEQIYENSR